MITTWAHVINATSAKFVAELVCGGKPKISDGNSEAIVIAENVLRLEVSVVNAETVAVFDCIEQLKENVLDERVVPEVTAAVQNLGKEVVVRRVVHDDVCVVSLFYNAMESDHARVDGSELVQRNFTYVNLALAGSLLTGSDEAFDGIGL